MKTKLYVSIDDGGFPVFNLTADKISGVEIEATPAQKLRWKRAAAEYAKAQKALHALVDLYQPLAIKEARAARVARPVKT
jgi:hypothetical protein